MTDLRAVVLQDVDALLVKLNKKMDQLIKTELWLKSVKSEICEQNKNNPVVI